MIKEGNSIYERNTLEFVTVALEYCSFVENAVNTGVFDFVDKATKILPLLYLKASLLPQLESEELFEPEFHITEEMYDSIRSSIAALLADKDIYLDTFHADMKYSETPIASFISENMADIYQDVGNFIALFREGNEIVMREALSLCYHNFCDYWGQPALNALKALHCLRYADEELKEQSQE